MKNLEKTLKDNAKLLDGAVAKKLDSITNRALSSREIDRIMQCIYCDRHLRYNRLFFDIVDKLYEIYTGVVPVRSKIFKKCTHPRWALCSNRDILVFLERSIDCGYPDIWAMAGDITKLPSFGPKEAIQTLANFDLMEFVLKKHAYSTRALELYTFISFYLSYAGRQESKKYDKCEDCAFYESDCDEIKIIVEKLYQWAIENKRLSAPYVVEQKIIAENGKGITTRFTPGEIDTLIFSYKRYWLAYQMRDFVLDVLKDIGKEWILSLDPNNYDMTNFDDAEVRLKLNQSLMTKPTEPKSTWDYRKKDLLVWKEEAERQLGRKISL
jgi:hypothetical protein